MVTLVLAVFLIVGATFLAGYAVLDAIFGKTPIQRRLTVLRRFRVRTVTEEVPLLRRLVVSAGQQLEAVPLLVRLAARDEDVLDRLGGQIKPTEWLAIRFATMIGTSVLLLFLLPWAVAILIGLILGYLITGFYLSFRISRRERQFGDELPGALNLMTSSLRAGFTLHQAVEAAVRDDGGPVAVELRRALAETRIGGSFEDAIERVGERMHSTEVVWLVMALRLQREVGGSLVDVMQTTSDTMRERAYIKRHVRSLSGEGRISAWVLTCMPPLTALAIQLTQPGYLRPLFTEPFGLLLLAVALIGMGLGGLWLRQVVKVEV
ncbi:type II secretion system F family protein [Actinoplanes sp. G11-F43]|uniref:type II secretion system F family protein n=1 Tax=Actinoplanes sp. G11-F43 TaxID=3424130 RepID=UPI003D3395B7